MPEAQQRSGASVGGWIFAFFVCIALFRLRRWVLSPAVAPDGSWQGYTPDDVRAFFSVLGPAARQIYAWTEVTLDALFPLLYATILAPLILRTTWPAVGHYARWLPWLAAAADYVENVLLACIAWDGCSADRATLASLFTRGKWGLIAVSLLCVAPGLACALWRARWRIVAHLPYLYLVRVPLLLALALVGLPVLAMGGARNVLGNLVVLTPGELFWVAVATVLGAATVLATARVVLLYGEVRFGVGKFGGEKEVPAWQLLVPLFIAGWSIAFALVASLRGVPRDDRGLASTAVLILAAIAGGLTGALLVWLVEGLRFLIAEPPVTDPQGAAGVSRLPDLVLPARLYPSRVHSARLPWMRPGAPATTAPGATATPPARPRWPGYIDQETGELLPGHLFAMLVFGALVVLYALAFYCDAPRADRGSAVPALVYLLALVVLPTWALGAAAFFLDRHRIPAIVVPAALLALAFLWPADHFFRMTVESPRQPGTVGRAQPADLVKRLDGCVLTAVAASGGGIRAAGWTAQVLTGLQREDPRFAPSLKLVSAVSGGSVGTMYYVGAFSGAAGPPAASLDQIVDVSMRSSLNDVAWGFAYPDLWRTFVPERLVPASVTDRGWALEQAWGRDWPRRDDMLRDWRDETAAGRRPAIAFNATLVETGVRLALGTFDRPQASMQTLTFEDVYGSRNMSILTAARLSATFTYVTPVARSEEKTAAKWHIADGGYQDNYGVATLVDWLTSALIEPRTMPVDEKGQPCNERLRVAIVRIGSHEMDTEPRNRSWAFQVGAPVQVLLAIRTAGPRSRNEMELGLLRDSGLGRRVGVFCFDYDSDDAPLSWHLSAAQRRRIREAWQTPPNQDARSRLRQFLDGDGSREFGC